MWVNIYVAGLSSRTFSLWLIRWYFNNETNDYRRGQNGIRYLLIKIYEKASYFWSLNWVLSVVCCFQIITDSLILFLFWTTYRRFKPYPFWWRYKRTLRAWKLTEKFTNWLQTRKAREKKDGLCQGNSILLCISFRRSYTAALTSTKLRETYNDWKCE